MATTSPEMDKATCKELVLELTKGVSNVQCPHRDRERDAWVVPGQVGRWGGRGREEEMEKKFSVPH